jgi:hypothetical protein
MPRMLTVRFVHPFSPSLCRRRLHSGQAQTRPTPAHTCRGQTDSSIASASLSLVPSLRDYSPGPKY